MEEQVRECHATHRDAQVVHLGEIGLPSFAWLMPLFEDHVLLRPMQRFPLRDVALQGAHLDRLIPLGMSLAQQRKQRRPEASPDRVAAPARPTASLLQMGSGAFATCGDVSVRWANFPAPSYRRAVHSLIPARAATTCWVAPLCLACINSLTSVSFFT